jgi:hypothetical protein
MTWTLTHAEEGKDYQHGETNEVWIKGEWSDEHVQQAAQQVINTIDVSVKREAIEILKEFLPTPLRDVL